MVGDGWTQTTLGSIADKRGYGLVDGPFGSNLPASAYTDAGIPVIRGSNLSLWGSRFDDSEFVFVSEETAQRLNRSLCRAGDIIFTKKGTLGQTGFVPKHPQYQRFLLSSNQMKLTVDQEVADPLFVYYYVSSPWAREKLVRDSEMTGVPKTNTAYLREFPILLPPIREQQAISCILGTLDDKIELNRRMNETLERMARAIFKSWFVDFDPVRAKLALSKGEGAAGQQPSGLAPHIADLFSDAFVESELGEIPKGWEVSTLGTIANEVRDTVQPADIEPGTPYIALEHMPRRCIALNSWGMADDIASAKLRFKVGDILFGKLRPYFHKVGPAPLDGVCSTDIVVCRPQNDLWYGLTLGHMSDDAFVAYTDSGSTGTKMPRTNWRYMSAFKRLYPK